MSNKPDHKSKLDQIWNELKMNLPEINFNETDNNDNESTEGIASTKNLDIDFIGEDEDNALADVNSNSPTWYECEKNFEKYLKKDEQAKYLNENDLSLSEDESPRIQDNKHQTCLNDQILEISTNKSKTFKSNEQAVQITKTIFDTTSSKLSMGIFESINFDDLLNSVGSKINLNDKNFMDYKPNQSPTESRLVNDENVLMKLAQISHSISKDEDLNSLDFKTGALVASNTKSTGTDDMISSSAFNLIENELKNSQDPFSISENIIKTDLNNFLKAHSIKDGNLVATRRIDLRPSQQINQSKQAETFKKPAELLMQNILNTDDDEKYFRNISKQPVKFLNDSDNEETSSSSDSDSDDDSKCLWIERYRRQKISNLNGFVTK